MSFEVFVAFWENGKEAGVDGDAIWDAFSPYATVEDATSWRLRHGDADFCTVLLGRVEGTNLIDGFAVWHPCDDERLWTALFEILRLGNGAIFFPGCRHFLVADAGAIPHIPPDLMESLGPPLVVKNGREIMADIEES